MWTYGLSQPTSRGIVVINNRVRWGLQFNHQLMTSISCALGIGQRFGTIRLQDIFISCPGTSGLQNLLSSTLCADRCTWEKIKVTPKITKINQRLQEEVSLKKLTLFVTVHILGCRVVTSIIVTEIFAIQSFATTLQVVLNVSRHRVPQYNCKCCSIHLYFFELSFTMPCRATADVRPRLSITPLTRPGLEYLHARFNLNIIGYVPQAMAMVWWGQWGHSRLRSNMFSKVILLLICDCMLRTWVPSLKLQYDSTSLHQNLWIYFQELHWYAWLACSIRVVELPTRSTT